MHDNFLWQNHRFACMNSINKGINSYYCNKNNSICSMETCNTFIQKEKKLWHTSTTSISAKGLDMVVSCDIHDVPKLTKVIDRLIEKKITKYEITKMRVENGSF